MAMPVLNKTETTIITRIEKNYERLQKARQLAAEGKVSPVLSEVRTEQDQEELEYLVEGLGGLYQVSGGCSCPDAEYREDVHQGWCKHKLAVELYKETRP